MSLVRVMHFKFHRAANDMTLREKINIAGRTLVDQRSEKPYVMVNDIAHDVLNFAWPSYKIFIKLHIKWSNLRGFATNLQGKLNKKINRKQIQNNKHHWQKSKLMIWKKYRWRAFELREISSFHELKPSDQHYKFQLSSLLPCGKLIRQNLSTNLSILSLTFAT